MKAGILLKGGAESEPLNPSAPVGGGFWLLAFFILLSLLAHALAFYVFQIIYPPPAAIAPPPADVSLLNLSDPANDAIRRWIEAQDPSLLSASRESVPKSLLTFPYQPSYAGVHSTPKTVDAEPQAVVPPPARDPADVIRAAAAQAPLHPAPAAPREMSVRFSGPLANRGFDAEWRMHPMRIPAGGTVPILQPARFLIAVTGEGGVRYSFLQESSGSRQMDDLAEAQFANVRFTPADAPLTWGVATFFWGNESYPR